MTDSAPAAPADQAAAEVLEAYLAALRELDRAARSGDLSAFSAAESRWADVADVYVEDLERAGALVPDGLRAQVAVVRERNVSG